VFAARIAELLRLHALGVLLLVLSSRVVAVLAIAALQRDDFSHDLIPFYILGARLAGLKPSAYIPRSADATTQ
jgi:hypothetical protein